MKTMLMQRSGLVLRASYHHGNRYLSMATTGCACQHFTNINKLSAVKPHYLYAARHMSGSNQSPNFDDKVQENLANIRKGDFKAVTHPEQLAHFRKEWKDVIGVKDNEPPVGSTALPHPIWSEEELHNVQITHKEPKTFIDKIAYLTVKLLRGAFDLLSGYNRGTRNEKIWLHRIIFLETVAGVPGMVAAMVRHLHSLRRMRRDHGWIHTLLEEAENERMHLMTAMCLKNPSVLFRGCVMGAQGGFVSFFSIAYLISPQYCHRLVGYLEEEAVVTYSKLLKDMEEGGPMHHWVTMPGPDIAIDYWRLKADAKMYDVVLAIRADEAHHRVVNHTLGSMKPDDYNPYKPGE